jgi:hypothetical protein
LSGVITTLRIVFTITASCFTSSALDTGDSAWKNRLWPGAGTAAVPSGTVTSAVMVTLPPAAIGPVLVIVLPPLRNDRPAGAASVVETRRAGVGRVVAGRES